MDFKYFVIQDLDAQVFRHSLTCASLVAIVDAPLWVCSLTVLLFFVFNLFLAEDLNASSSVFY
jgi:hypothetical protein